MGKTKLVWLFPGVIFIWAIYPFLFSHDLTGLIWPWMNWTKRGQIGDSFGALNTLFSGLALVGLAINIRLQSIQLEKLEKKEQENENLLKEQIHAMKDSAMLEYLNSVIAEMEKHSNELTLELQKKEIEASDTSTKKEKLNDELQILQDRVFIKSSLHYQSELEKQTNHEIKRIKLEISKLPSEEEFAHSIRFLKSRYSIHFKSMEIMKDRRRKILARLNTQSESGNETNE